MAVNEHERFIGGAMDKGISLFASAIDVNLSWASEVFNVTSGIRQGVGPRYGIAPLPGQVSLIAPATGTWNNFTYSQGTVGTGLTYRQKIYGIYYSSTLGCFYAVVGVFRDNKLSFDVVFSGQQLEADPSYVETLATFTAGWSESGYVNRPDSGSTTSANRIAEYLPWAKNPLYRTSFQDYFVSPDDNYLNSAFFNVTGKNVQYNWQLGVVVTDPTATTPPSVSFGSTTLAVSGSAAIRLGLSTRFNVNEQRVKEAPRCIKYFCLTNNGYPLDMRYTAQVSDADLNSSLGMGDTGAMYNVVTTDVVKSGASTSYSSADRVLVYDTGMTTSSKRDVVMLCGEAPLAVIFQDGVYNPTGLVPRYFDLTSTAAIPRDIGIVTAQEDGGSSDRKSAFINGKVSQDMLWLNTDEGSEGGLFEFDVPYDLGIAFYNKLLDYESNVIYLKNLYATQPVDYEKDNFSLKISGHGNPDNMWHRLQTYDVALPFDFSGSSVKSGYPAGQGLFLNDFSYRFYYREAGIGEWLPLEEYDASQLWFYPATNPEFISGVPLLGKAPTARTTGGAANAFQDYSMLPKLPYFQVLNFNQRAFWFEAGSFRFSSSTHEFHYPTRNIVSAATGDWRGAIPFMRQNDVAAQSVLIVFSAQATYLAQFTGNMATQVVRVSANSVGEFTVDGSDFVMDVLTDLTAFSYRSAVLAEGECYWWGPQGIVYFAGRGAPEIISVPLESDNEAETIYGLPDPNTYHKIHAVYSPLTSEVIWFYTPATPDPDFPTHYLCFNTQSRQYMRGRLPCEVDHAQNVEIGGSGYAPKSEGSRLALYSRKDSESLIQTAVLFDKKNPMADMGPGKELLVSAIGEPTTGTRRLTMALGSVDLLSSGVTVGDYILVQRATNYAPGLTGTNDFIAKITDVNYGSPAIDILLPTGATMDTFFSATSVTALPVFHREAASRGLHGIPWVVTTNYWLPNGLINSYVWEYLHFLFKYAGMPQPSDPFNPMYGILAEIVFQNRTLVCDGPSTSLLKLINNSTDHCQIHHRVKNENRSANGQALAMRFNGIAFGDPWTLEYLEAQCILEKGFTLKEFQQ